MRHSILGLCATLTFDTLVSRELQHRVKSVSMSSFTDEEVKKVSFCLVCSALAVVLSELSLHRLKRSATAKPVAYGTGSGLLSFGFGVV